MKECLGLPCIHKVAVAIATETPLSPNDFHLFWRQINTQRILGMVHFNIGYFHFKLCT